MESFDVLVVGAGPAGLSVAAEARYHELGTVLVLEKGDEHSAAIRRFYPDHKRVDAEYKGQEAICAGVLCFRDTSKDHFLEVMDELIATYAIDIRTGAGVDSITHDGERFTVSAGDVSFSAGIVAIAIGRMGKPNRPDYYRKIPAALRKNAVWFDVNELPAEDRDILVVGGGNSAVEYALSLSDRGRVVLSYRRAEFHRLNPMNAKLLAEEEAADGIEVRRESNVSAVEERDGRPWVTFAEGGDRAFDHVVYGIGGSSPAGFLASAGCTLDEDQEPVLDAWQECVGRPDLYVVGELAVPKGKGSIIVSFNSGKKAVEGMMEKRGLERKPEIVKVPPKGKLDG